MKTVYNFGVINAIVFSFIHKYFLIYIFIHISADNHLIILGNYFSFRSCFIV
ncbi:hypothetical protein HMPREF9104_00955 [Lentilactobacillus kisonensis F0435]|uniref:Uncharacterized protein n=1 Tax=Lentilactobacillus kisonensis F0435 TaxID=797516 RepID=H1LEC9_9LACO|nr:hypothetical protein HMPREF9104_00955 [Lentilactobacillus kisonensis F0435]